MRLVNKRQQMVIVMTHHLLNRDGAVMDINDDNDPALKNIPTNTEPSTNTVFNE